MRPKKLIASFLPLAAIAAVPSPSARPAGVQRLAADAEARWVPFELTPGNQIRFTALLDGKPVNAILDTGVSYSVLSSRAAAGAKRIAAPIGSASAIGGTVPVGWTQIRHIEVGGLTQTGGGLAVADLPALAVGSATPVDLLVGRDLTAGYAVDIDYASRRFRLLASGRLPFNGETAPLSISPDRLVYVSQVTIAGTTVQPMLVDTGDGSTLTLSTPSWAGLDPKPKARITDTISYGIGGAIVTQLTVLPQVTLGSLIARNVEVRIEDARGFSQAIGLAGRIGSGFLQRYRVLLDPGAGRMVLAPTPATDVAPDRSTSGLLMGLQRGELVVLHVMRGSPAAAGGWKAGDRICSVDDAAIPRDYLDSPLSRWSVGKPGRIVRLELCDGRRRSLTLRHFY